MTQEWFTAIELAGKPGMPDTKSGVIRKVRREDWNSRTRKARGGGREYHLESLPIETQAACLVGKNDPISPPSDHAASLPECGDAAPFIYDRDNLWSHYDSKSDKQKDSAKQKLDLLNAVMYLVDNGTGLVDGFKAIGAANDKSWRTIQGWYHGTNAKPGMKHYERSDWLAALVPGYVGRTNQADCNADAWETFKADYLRLEQPTATACYYRLKRSSNAHNWQIPALRTFERRIKQIPRTIRVLMREGEQGLLRLYPAQQRTVRELHALEWINGDGYQHNVFVKWPNGEIARPKTWFWQDVYSRKILGYRVDVTENTDSIRLSFGDVVENFGIPDHVTIDNTRSAANKWMTGGVPNRYRFKVKDDDPIGLIPALGAKVHWTSVYKGKGHGQAKPIERAFGVGGIGEVVDKHPAFVGAFTGHNTSNKPENYGDKAIPVERFLAVLQQEIIAWNARENRRTEICGGVMSYDQAFNAGYESAPIRKATEEQRRLWMLSAEAIKVRQDGTFTLDAGSAVGHGNNRYHAAELFEFDGHKIVIRFDPENLHGEVFTYTLDGRYIAKAQCIQATGFGNTEAARAFSKERKRFIRASKLAAKAEVVMDSMQVADQLPPLPATDIPNAKVVRPLRANPKLGRPVPQPSLNDEQQANVLDFQRSFEQPVATVSDGPQDRYRRWYRLDNRLRNGQQLKEEDQKFWARYQKGNEYQSMKDFFSDFKDELEIEA